jgi:hypothetical protein
MLNFNKMGLIAINSTKEDNESGLIQAIGEQNYKGGAILNVD